MIVITTPTGQIGGQVLDTVLDGAEAVRVIVRDPSRLPAGVRERAEIVQGSHDDLDVLTKALAGADGLLWLVPPNPRAEDVQELYLGFARPACEAIRSQGVEHVVAVSSLGRAYGGNAGLLSPAFAMDDLIESTGVNYRSLGMPFFMENLLHQVDAIKNTGMFFLPNSADRTLAVVATRDIAAVAAGLLLDRSWTGQEGIPVISPDALSPNAMAQIMSEVLERPVRFQQVSTADHKATMTGYGMTDAWAQALADMATAQNNGIYDPEHHALTTPAPTTFHHWCQHTLKPAV